MTATDTVRFISCQLSHYLRIFMQMLAGTLIANSHPKYSNEAKY